MGHDSIEAVSGGVDASESSEQAARRELKEELGITAAKWLDLGLVGPLTSVLVSPARIYLAQKLSHSNGTPRRHRID